VRGNGVIINSIPSNNANLVAPFAPLGRQLVGQESNDLKTSSFKALEQSAESARGENRRPDPSSGQERSVASSEAKLEAEARAELSARKNAELQQKQRLDEQEAKERKQEEEKKAAEDERLRDQERRDLARKEQETEQVRAELARELSRATAKNNSINRHLVEIGVVKGLPSRGNFFDQRV
jgi:hypothetical protein